MYRHHIRHPGGAADNMHTAAKVRVPAGAGTPHPRNQDLGVPADERWADEYCNTTQASDDGRVSQKKTSRRILYVVKVSCLPNT